VTTLDAALEERVREIVAELVRPEPESRFVSKAKLAELLGVTERRVKTLRERGLPARKIGRDLYFEVAEVERFLDREGR
jgi:hypothetical protein